MYKVARAFRQACSVPIAFAAQLAMPAQVRSLAELAASHSDIFNSYTPDILSRFLRLLDRIETKAAADDVDEPGLAALLNEFQPVLVGALHSVIRCQER